MVTTFAGNGTADGTSVYWAELNAHSIWQGMVSSASVSTLAGNVTLCPPACAASSLFVIGGNYTIRRIQ